jgi:hypothetical protein
MLCRPGWYGQQLQQLSSELLKLACRFEHQQCVEPQRYVAEVGLQEK